ncbi:MAG TPA: hypothetical protein VGJ20_30065 [Xanthobacteraceae bacterium]
MRNLARCVLLIGLLTAGAPTPALPAELVLANTSGATLYQVYLSPCGTRFWGPNQLQGTKLWSSKSFIISNIAPGCYDLMVIIPPWNECMATGVYMRSEMLWTITWATVEQSNFGDCSTSPHTVPEGGRPFIEEKRF